MEESSPLDQLVRDSLLFSLESPRISQKHLVPAAAVRLMKRRVLSRPGVNSLMSSLAWSVGVRGILVACASSAGMKEPKNGVASR